jgi:hypothetical protein
LIVLYWFEISDFTQIQPENINNNAFISELKKQVNVQIPLHKTVRTILKKVHNKLPKAYTNQVTNLI